MIRKKCQMTDMETCYKLVPSEIMKSIDIQSEGFGIEPEITTKMLKKGYTIGEVSIHYKPRTKEEGKHIN